MRACHPASKNWRPSNVDRGFHAPLPRFQGKRRVPNILAFYGQCAGAELFRLDFNQALPFDTLAIDACTDSSRSRRWLILPFMVRPPAWRRTSKHSPHFDERRDEVSQS